MEFSYERFHNQILGTFSREAIGYNLQATNATPGSAVWPVANQAIFIPFTLTAQYRVQKVWWNNGTAVAGNVDCGVYTGEPTTPTKLFSSGSTAQATVSVVQSVALGTPFVLTPGSYYLALSCSSGSATMIRSNQVPSTAQVAGVAIQTAALPLPATATLASISTTTGMIPLFGITSGTVI